MKLVRTLVCAMVTLALPQITMAQSMWECKTHVVCNNGLTDVHVPGYGSTEQEAKDDSTANANDFVASDCNDEPTTFTPAGCTSDMMAAMAGDDSSFNRFRVQFTAETNDGKKILVERIGPTSAAASGLAWPVVQRIAGQHQGLKLTTLKTTVNKIPKIHLAYSVVNANKANAIELYQVEGRGKTAQEARAAARETAKRVEAALQAQQYTTSVSDGATRSHAHYGNARSEQVTYECQTGAAKTIKVSQIRRLGSAAKTAAEAAASALAVTNGGLTPNTLKEAGKHTFKTNQKDHAAPETTTTMPMGTNNGM